MERQEMKEEALKRMKELHLAKDCIKCFEENDEVWASETCNGMSGILFSIKRDTELKELISKFEKEYDALVYHCVRTNTTFGKLVTCFYVCSDKSEWDYDWNDFKEDCAVCYVINLDDETCSEIGSIMFRRVNSGIERTA